MTVFEKEPSSLALVADPALEALLQLAHLAAGFAAAEEVLAALAKAAVRQLGADAAASLRLERPSTAVVVAAEGEALAGWKREVDAFDRGLGEELAQSCAFRYGKVHTLPLVSDADLFGALVLFFESAAPLEARSLRVARALAELAASALAKAARYEALERALGERDEAQRKLRATVDHLQALIDTAGSVILFLSPAGAVLEFNRAAERVFGYLREEVLGTSYVERFVPPEQREAVRADIARVLDGGSTRNYENDVVGSDGTRRTLLWNAERLVDDSGATAGIVAVGQDISERKQLENELIQAQKMEAIGRLASGVAHDFNNVLMGITGMADVALAHLPHDHDVRPFVEEIKEAGMRGAGLTRQLKSFARRRPSVAQVVDLNQVVRRSEPLLGQVLSQGVELRLRLEANGARAVADAGQLEQALLNLAINACDAMPQGGALTVRTSTRDRDTKSWVGVSVSDTGTGMDEALRRRIFEPFFTTKEEGRGTGLGLSQVRAIVESAGGYVEVESAPGEGATFHLWLPRTERAVELTRAEEAEAPRGKSETVLLVEDEQLVRMSLRHWLEDGGYRVLTAASGDEAAALLARGERFDALVTDIRLPGLSGFELSRRARDALRALPIVYMSAHAEMSEDGARLEGVPMLIKPFRRDALLRALARVLGKRAKAPARARKEERKSTILVVDDQQAARSAIRLLLSQRYRVVEAAEGVEALSRLGGDDLDVLLTDIVLPGMPVTELVREIRGRYPKVHVIYMSGHEPDDSLVIEAMKVENACFVEKPIDIDALDALLDRLLSG